MTEFPKLMKSRDGQLIVAFYSKTGAVVVTANNHPVFKRGHNYPDFWFIDELEEDDGERIWREC